MTRLNSLNSTLRSVSTLIDCTIMQFIGRVLAPATVHRRRTARRCHQADGKCPGRLKSCKLIQIYKLQLSQQATNVNSKQEEHTKVTMCSNIQKK